MSNPLSLILRRLEAEPSVFRGDELKLGNRLWVDEPDWDKVFAPTTPATALPCTSCGTGHVCSVVRTTDERTGQTCGMVTCPECGTYEICLDDLRRWTVAVPGFLNLAFRSARVTFQIHPLVPGRLWRVGKATWGGRSREILFFRGAFPDQEDRCVPILGSHPKSLLFVPTDSAAQHWDSLCDNPVFALINLLECDDGSVRFSVEAVESRLVDEGLVTVERKKPKAKKRGERAAKIEALENELIQHLRDARDHARSTQDLTGTPVLLPRPSQKELAVRTNMSESDVSRCLSDNDARELRVYWETAADLNKLLSYGDDG